MDDDILIDPTTKQEFNLAASTSFDEFLEALGEVDWDSLSCQDIAEMFFYNGFYRGCTAMTDNPDLQETIHMMAEETNYQLKEK